MQPEFISYKAYFEGIEIPIESAQVISGESCSATVTIAKVNYSLLSFKAGTLLHLFILHKNEWRIFFMGKLAGRTMSKASCQLSFESIFDELSKAYYTPVDISSTYFGHLTPLLYVSNADQKDRDSRGEDETQILLMNSNSDVEYFSFNTLQAAGSVEKTIQDFLRAAASVNPSFKIYHDLFKFQDWFYILNNPNIFPIAKVISMGNLIKSAFNTFNFKITYQDVINVLLRLLRYKIIKLNTPVKIDGNWRWVLMLPDTSWLPAVTDIELMNEEVLSYTINDRAESKITRAQMHFYNTEAVIDMIANKGFGFIFSYPDSAVEVIKGKDDKFRAYIRFTGEEALRGVNASNISLDDKETYYALTDWGKLDRSTDTPVEFEKMLNKDVNLYFQEMAKYKFLQSRFKSIGLTSFNPVFNPADRYIFPVQIKQIPNYVFNIKGTMYDITQNAMSMSIFPENIRDLTAASEKISPKTGELVADNTKDVNLRWNPVEYTSPNAKGGYYDKYTFDELMKETEFWEVYKGSWSNGKPRYHYSTRLNAQYIAHTKEDISGSIVSIFSMERALAVKEYCKIVYGKDIELIAVNNMDMNAQPSAKKPTVSQGGMTFEREKGEGTKLTNEGYMFKEYHGADAMIVEEKEPHYPDEGPGTPNSISGLEKEHYMLVDYTNWIEHGTAKFKLGNSNWVRAIILIESRGHTKKSDGPLSRNAVSGATGLMQVMEENVYDKIKKIYKWKKTPGGENVTIDDLYNPKININIGCYILRYFINTSGGDLEKAIFKYSGSNPKYFDKILKVKEQLQNNDSTFDPHVLVKDL